MKLANSYFNDPGKTKRQFANTNERRNSQEPLGTFINSVSNNSCKHKEEKEKKYSKNEYLEKKRRSLPENILFQEKKEGLKHQKKDQIFNKNMLNNLSEKINKQNIICLETIYETESIEAQQLPPNTKIITKEEKPCIIKKSPHLDKNYRSDVSSIHEVKSEGQWCFNTENSLLNKIIPKSRDAIPYSVSINSIVKGHNSKLSSIKSHLLADLISKSSKTLLLDDCDFKLPFVLPVMPMNYNSMQLAKSHEDCFEYNSQSLTNNTFESTSSEDTEWQNVSVECTNDVSCNTSSLTQSGYNKQMNVRYNLETDLLDNIYQTISFTYRKNSTDIHDKDDINRKEFEKLLSSTAHYLRKHYSKNSNIDMANACTCGLNKSHIENSEIPLMTYKNRTETSNECLTHQLKDIYNKESAEIDEYGSDTLESMGETSKLKCINPVQKRQDSVNYFSKQNYKKSSCNHKCRGMQAQKVALLNEIHGKLDLNDVQISYDDGKFVIFLEKKRRKARKTLWTSLSDKIERILKATSLSRINIGTLFSKQFSK